MEANFPLLSQIVSWLGFGAFICLWLSIVLFALRLAVASVVNKALVWPWPGKGYGNRLQQFSIRSSAALHQAYHSKVGLVSQWLFEIGSSLGIVAGIFWILLQVNTK